MSLNRIISFFFIVFLGIFIYFGFKNADFWLVIPFLVVFWLIIVIIGSFHIRWNYFLTSIHHSKNANGIALTFDDGPNPDFTPKVLSILKKYNAKATFFCIGKNIEKHPDLLLKIVEEGHTIGNHSYSHSNQNGFFSTPKIIQEIEETQSVIFKIIGKKPRFFRPPFGVTNPNIARAIKATQMISIGWNRRSYDTKAHSNNTIAQKLLKQTQNGDIILLHDTSEVSCQILEQYLKNIQPKNLHFVNLETFLNQKAYE